MLPRCTNVRPLMVVFTRLSLNPGTVGGTVHVLRLLILAKRVFRIVRACIKTSHGSTIHGHTRDSFDTICDVCFDRSNGT